MQDVRDALRALRAAPIVSAVAVLSLALGIGANTAIFSIVNSLMLRTLPVHEPERLAAVQFTGRSRASWPYIVWEQVRERQGLFAGAAAYAAQRFNAAHSGETDFVYGFYASGEFFETLGVPAILGRTFAVADDTRGGGPDGPVAVISYAYWQRRFAGATDAIGQQIALERVPFTVIGVTPPEFFGPVIGRTFDVIVPFGTEPLLRARSGLDERRMYWVEMLLRLRPEQTIESATRTLRGIQPQIREAALPPAATGREATEYLKEPFALVRAGADASPIRSRYARPTLTLMAVVGLVLLIACANIANLMLARSIARRRELTVRAALGASRARLARQLLVESLVLAGLGAAAGLVFARWASVLLVRQMSNPEQRIFLDVAIDAYVLAFTAGLAVGTALLFGVVPAFRATGVQAGDALKEQARGVAGEGRLGCGSALVVVQIALSLVLIVAAGLFVGTFARLAALDVGFDAGQVLVTSVNAQRSSTKPDARLALFERLRTAAAGVPGAASAAATLVTPVAGMVMQFPVSVPGAPEMAELDRVVHVNLVSPDFFATYGTRLLAGRDFAPTDGPGGPPVAIVNEAFARTFLHGSNPVHRTVDVAASPREPAVSRQIVGYVEDAVYHDLRQAVPPTLYLPLAQRGDDPLLAGGTQISVRAARGSPALLTRAVANALTSIDPDLALTFRPLADQVRNSLAQERAIAMVSGFFGGLALLLASLGLYGVTSYAVSRRRGEIGIRMALGAEPGAMVAMVLRRVATLVVAGVLVGAAFTVWAARFVEALLFGIESRDAVTLAASAAVLAAIGGIAGWLPARRAARIEPAEVLREV